MPQETNMAELLRLMQNMIVKVDNLATDMKDVKSDVQELKTKVDRLEGKIDSIADTVIMNDRRLTAVEHDVSDLKSREH